MRTVIAAFLFCLTSSIAYAQAFQTNKPVICDETKKVISALNDQWNEKLVWTAADGRDQSRYALFVNEKTKTWTMLQLTLEVACIVGVGDKSELVLGVGI